MMKRSFIGNTWRPYRPPLKRICVKLSGYWTLVVIPMSQDFLKPQFLSRLVLGMEKSPQLIPDRYEFAVYRMLKIAFESGDIFNQNTTKYRSFTDDLIPMNRWKADKQNVLNDLDLPVLQRPISQTLQELKDELEEKLKHVNQRIINRKNKDVKFNNYRKGRTVNWTLPYKKEEDEDNHHFYHLVPTISITNLLSYVDKKTGFLAGFNHVLGRYTKGNQDKKSLIACIIALGTNMSLGRMGEISDISH
ncbi:Tn3 family transposase [Photorhabdus kayaii]|nr:Tn3 family transposase [Photorhabdus kayaii]